MFNILVVDRNITRANIISRAIKDLRFGTRIYYALSATQTIMYLAGTKAASKSVPHIILLSDQLPDTTALDCLKTVVESVACDHTSVIMVSENVDPSSGAEFYQCGASAMVSGCADPEELMSSIADTVAYVAMVMGLIPKQDKFFPDAEQRIPSMNEVLQVHL